MGNNKESESAKNARKSGIDMNNIPDHVAVIMDGNGRWARKRLLNRAAGHRAGAQTLKKLVPEAENLGVKYLTVYAFSTENWNRDEKEVNDLMNLLREYIQDYIDDSKKNETKISVIGEISRLDKDLRDKIAYLTELTKNKTGLNVIIAINYGGRDEIVRAVKKICEDVVQGEVTRSSIDEALISAYLDTAGIPDPDLLIRTSGEIRLSNFLMWQTAYTEFFVSNKYWPDFNINDLKDAILQYQQRDRRFGRIR